MRTPSYILVSDRLLRDTDPMAFAALLTGGAATAFLVFGSVTGDVVRVGGSLGLVAVASGALVGSVFALSAFLAAIRLVGPGTASLLVTVEVPAGLLFAAVALGERLAGPQLAGAALVVGAIGLLQLRVQLPRTRRLVSGGARVDRADDVDRVGLARPACPAGSP